MGGLKGMKWLIQSHREVCGNANVEIQLFFFFFFLQNQILSSSTGGKKKEKGKKRKGQTY